MKKFFRVFPLIIIMALVATSCSTARSAVITPALDAAVSKAILDDNHNSHDEGECPAEGHIIFDAKRDGDGFIIYSYIYFVCFGFENDKFVDVSGCSMPAVIRLDSLYRAVDIQYPKDGSEYKKSIKRMFPSSIVNKLDLSDADEKNLNDQLFKYANDYLKSIGRKAEVGFMSDFNYELLNIDTDISNAITTNELIAAYPYYIGNKETLENGKRYVYQKDYDKSAKMVIYTKYEYQKPKSICEQFIFDATTGKLVKK